MGSIRTYTKEPTEIFLRVLVGHNTWTTWKKVLPLAPSKFGNLEIRYYYGEDCTKDHMYCILIRVSSTSRFFCVGTGLYVAPHKVRTVVITEAFTL